MSGRPTDATGPGSEEPSDRAQQDDDEIDEESEESFPASDAPQHWAGPPET